MSAEVQCWRVKRFVFSPIVFAQLMSMGNKFQVQEGVPPGSVITRVLVNEETGCLTLFVEHESFDLIPEGTPVPIGPIGWTSMGGENGKVPQALDSATTQ